MAPNDPSGVNDTEKLTGPVVWPVSCACSLSYAADKAKTWETVLQIKTNTCHSKSQRQ